MEMRVKIHTTDGEEIKEEEREVQWPGRSPN
jgi:hypothetical protein